MTRATRRSRTLRGSDSGTEWPSGRLQRDRHEHLGDGDLRRRRSLLRIARSTGAGRRSRLRWSRLRSFGARYRPGVGRGSEASMGMLDGKVVAVTGAGRGIGRGEALLIAAEGAQVVVNDLGGEWDGTGRDDRPASQVVEEITGAGGEALAHFDDISEPEGAKSLVGLALETWGRIDGLVNNAGILRDKMSFTMPLEDWDAVIKVHLRGTFLCTGAVCAHWRDRSKPGEDVAGAIVNTSSTSGLLGNVGQSNYGAAKAAIAAFTQIVSMEVQRYGVGPHPIAPRG